MSGTQSSHFKFKQFGLWHDQCGMKVSTDGVVLGAWAALFDKEKNEGDSGPIQVLDIGTGTGLLALMLAQRYTDYSGKLVNKQHSDTTLQTHITALELDLAAAQQARFNVEQSPWASAVSVEAANVIDWSQSADNNTNKYDHIICNPPYFSNSLNSPDNARDHARHNDSLSFEDLAVIVKRHLSDTGHFELILPIEEAKRFDAQATNAGLAKVAAATLQHSSKKAPNRLLIRYKHNNQVEQCVSFDEIVDTLTIRADDGQFHPSFAAITKAFYLKL